MGVSIARVLEHKGRDVLTAAAGDRVTDAVAAMAERNVGAVVVVDGEDIVGILSERDVVRRLAAEGAAVLERPVAEVMTTEVFTCGLDATTDELSEVMTARRFRHVPIVVDGRLGGIVSIGDVVRWRIDELATREAQLSEYVAGSY